MNTRNATSRRPVQQTTTAKGKKIPEFLLKGLNRTNNKTSQDEESSYSDIEVCILSNLNFLIQR
jgi:hypothetical protein